jgi:hypothetical protein
MRDLCVIPSHGKNIPLLAKTKRGSIFKFCEGDVIEFTYDAIKKELTCERRPGKLCVLGVKDLQHKDD